MAINLKSISKGTQQKAPRMIILGVEKIGKSTFACGSNAPIVLPIKQEEGVDALDCAKFPTLNSFDEVKEALGVLINDDHDYKTVVIDSASALEPLVYDDVCKKENATSIEKVGGGYGKGYTEALSRWRELMDLLDVLRNKKSMASILIGHIKIKIYTDPLTESYDKYIFDINDKASNALFRWADFVGFANTKTVVKKEGAGFNEKSRAIDTGRGQRFLFTQKSPAYPAGGRGAFGNLPSEIPLDWKSLMSALKETNNK